MYWLNPIKVKPIQSMALFSGLIRSCFYKGSHGRPITLPRLATHTWLMKETMGPTHCWPVGCPHIMKIVQDEYCCKGRPFAYSSECLGGLLLCNAGPRELAAVSSPPRLALSSAPGRTCVFLPCPLLLQSVSLTAASTATLPPHYSIRWCL